MMKIKKISLNLILLTGALILFEGCYTQLAYTQKVRVTKNPYYTQTKTIKKQQNDTLRVADTVYLETENPTIIYNSYYSFIEPDYYRFGYRPYRNRSYISVQYYSPWADPFFDPWYWDPYYSYNYNPGWCNSSWAWDSYYSAHYYYRPYRNPHYWTWYSQPYDYDQPPKEKRDWDRRGSGSDGPIVRPGGNAILASSNQPPTQSAIKRIVRRSDNFKSEREEFISTPVKIQRVDNYQETVVTQNPKSKIVRYEVKEGRNKEVKKRRTVKNNIGSSIGKAIVKSIINSGSKERSEPKSASRSDKKSKSSSRKSTRRR